MTPEQLKASILQRAMEGKLVPQDPDDEPASELLKRIKKEKEKLIKEGKIKRDKNETEIFRGDDNLHYEKFQDGTVQAIEVPYEIPSTWSWTRLENLTWLINDGTHTTPKYVEDGVPFLSVKNMSNGVLSFDNTKFVTQEEHEILSKRTMPERNDILYSKIGTTGVPVKVNTDSEFSIFVSLALLKFIPPYNPDFMVELLKSPIAFEQAKDGTRGVGNKNLVLKVIKKFFIPVPPKNEQNRILQKLDDYNDLSTLYTCQYNNLERINRELPDKLRKSILQYAMQGKLVPQDPNDEPVEVLLEKIRAEKQRLFEEGKLKKKDLEESIIYKGDDNSYYENIPENWIITRLTHTGEISTGNTPSKKHPEYYGGEYPFFKPSDLIQGISIVYPSEWLSALGVQKSRKIPKNSILVNGIGNIGVVGLTKVDSSFNQQMHGIIPRNYVNSKFLYWLISAYCIQNQMKDNSSSTTIPILNKSKFKNIVVAFPPLQEQERIIDAINLLFQKVNLLY